MQIDGHYALTYVLSRMVGFEHDKAEIIAYSAQYVDDATNSGIIEFDNGAMFSRISSAHTMEAYDLKYYLDAHENHLVWVPFHFLPGNDKLNAGENPDGSFIKKLICTPYSDVAVKMLDACIKDKDKPHFLHRVGITMHVFADTFAHQGFAGVVHDVNKVKNLVCHNYNMSFFDSLKSKTLSRKFPMGHGAALTCPDMPFLNWSYTNGLGEEIKRDNLDLFTNAAYDIFGQLGRVLSELGQEVKDPIENDMNQIKKNFENFRSDDGEVRLEQWLKSIKDGDFSFGSVDLNYIPKGIGSWKYNAINQDKEYDKKDEIFEFKDDFINSNWRNFHVALKSHRFDIVNNILPPYGIIVS
ncbi:hypothetical protein CRV02_13410 [Arcobacter sp. CECT 8989]|uniref:DUF6765 family protein n=1 Tax=Arcobacter sp. CECT 8989 TaxID=2044509 RepID=UPI00100B4D1B|nr:DUF6765 family protein [Arcobacter sp. CECT 8989]RXJ98485.1 hypothetical protein CRV02_13410 [Arcobacter sp. CECT 8989]